MDGWLWETLFQPWIRNFQKQDEWWCPAPAAETPSTSEISNKDGNRNLWKTLKALFSRVINLLLTKLARDRTGRISALGLFCTDRAQRGPYCQDLGPIFSQYGPRAWLIRYIYCGSSVLYDQRMTTLIRQFQRKILDNINKTVIPATKVKLWNSTSNVIDWLKAVPNKKNTHLSLLTWASSDQFRAVSEQLLMKPPDCAYQHHPTRRPHYHPQEKVHPLPPKLTMDKKQH